MFDLTTNVTTRDGRAARIVTTNGASDRYPIGALVTDSDGERYETYTRDGLYQVSGGEPENDLVKVPETRTTYVNLAYCHNDYASAQRYHLAFPVLKVVVEKGTNRLVSSEIATA